MIVFLQAREISIPKLWFIKYSSRKWISKKFVHREKQLKVCFFFCRMEEIFYVTKNKVETLKTMWKRRKLSSTLSIFPRHLFCASEQIKTKKKILQSFINKTILFLKIDNLIERSQSTAWKFPWNLIS